MHPRGLTSPFVEPVFGLRAASVPQFRRSRGHCFQQHVRVRWEYSPGSELFVVYGDGRNTDVDGFPQLQSLVLAAKITYLLGF